MYFSELKPTEGLAAQKVFYLYAYPIPRFDSNSLSEDLSQVMLQVCGYQCI